MARLVDCIVCQAILICDNKQTDKDYSEISENERDQAKKIVYGIVYGIGSNSLAEMLSVQPQEATQFIHSFLDKFPGFFDFLSILTSI